MVPQTERLYPVGRLDIDTTGLILLTNEGDLAHRLTHPSFEVEKTYRAVVGGPPVREPELQKLRDGVELDDGRTAPAKVRRVAADTIEITIHEGRKRQVKRMCEAVGHPVKRLERVAFGPLSLGDLPRGRWRKLTAARSTPSSSGRLGALHSTGNRACARSGAPERGRERDAATKRSALGQQLVIRQVRRCQGPRHLTGVTRTGCDATSRTTVNCKHVALAKPGGSRGSDTTTARATATDCTPTPTSRTRSSPAR